MEKSQETTISLLDQVRLQSEVLVPVLRRLRAELGTERANELVYTTIRDWLRQEYAKDLQLSGSPKQKWKQLSDELDKIVGDDIGFEVLRDDDEALDLDVKRCRYAEFFRELGEPQLGALLTCEIDDHIAAVGSPEVSLSRPQTIMQGAECCKFRWRFRNSE